MSSRSLYFVVSLFLTLYTEVLILEYIRNGVGIIVAICFLGWAVIFWIIFLKESIHVLQEC